MIFVLDNYDSFTYNLVQYIGELGAAPEVCRNDATRLESIAASRPSGIIISPGPGHPRDAGISVELVKRFSGTIPILGVCLGHQSIGVAFGAKIGRTAPVHGKSSHVNHDGADLFKGLESPFLAGRYHSLVVGFDSLPEELQVTARTEDGIVMGIQHREHVTFGVQFHPESILTPEGKVLLSNYLSICGEI